VLNRCQVELIQRDLSVSLEVTFCLVRMLRRVQQIMQFFTTYLPPGNQQLTMAYYGDKNAGSAFAIPFNINVGKAAIVANLKISPLSVGKGGTVAITVTFQYSSTITKVPTGQLEIFANQTVFSVLNFTGATVTKSFNNLTVGKTAVKVTYSGNDLFQSTTSTVTNVIVFACPNPIPTAACPTNQHRLCCTIPPTPTWTCKTNTVLTC